LEAGQTGEPLVNPKEAGDRLTKLRQLGSSLTAIRVDG
jgi:hypothetical protein